MRTVLALAALLSFPSGSDAEDGVAWRLGEVTGAAPRPLPFRWIADERRITLLSIEGDIEGVIDLGRFLPG